MAKPVPVQTFGDRLRILREDSGMTQAELAAKAGLHRQAILRIEAGKSDPVWSTVEKLSEALGVEPNHFQEPAQRQRADEPLRTRKA